MNVLLGFSILEDRKRMPGVVNAWLAERGLTQLVGRPLGEDRLLALAAQIEAGCGGPGRPPGPAPPSG